MRRRAARRWPRRDYRAASGFDPRREEANLPVVGIRAARLVGPPLRVDEIPARLGEQRELLERRGRPRLDRVARSRRHAQPMVDRPRRLGALRKSVPSEERNELEHQDEEDE